MSDQTLQGLISETCALANRIRIVGEQDRYRRVRHHLGAASSVVDIVQARLQEAIVLLRGPIAQATGYEVDDDINSVGAAIAHDAQSFPRCLVCKADSYTQCVCLEVTT